MKHFFGLLASALVGVSVAAAQTVGVFSDAAGTDCNLPVPYPGGPVIAYIFGTVDGNAADGVVAMHFRIAGLPTGWVATVIASDPGATVVLGDVFGEGVAIAYPVCTTGRRLLLTIAITPTSAVENVSLALMPHQPFWACGFESWGCNEPCPNFCGCGDLTIPCWCVQGVPSTINGPTCVVATAREGWGNVKSLYRH